MKPNLCSPQGGIQIGFRVLSAGITVVVLLAGHGLITLALVGLALGILRGVVWFLAVRRVIPQIRIAPRMATRTAAGALFSFGVFTFIAQVGDMVRFRIDNFVIGGFLGAAAITHYAIGAILVGFYQKTVHKNINRKTDVRTAGFSGSKGAKGGTKFKDEVVG